MASFYAVWNIGRQTRVYAHPESTRYEAGKTLQHIEHQGRQCEYIIDYLLVLHHTVYLGTLIIRYPFNGVYPSA